MRLHIPGTEGTFSIQLWNRSQLWAKVKRSDKIKNNLEGCYCWCYWNNCKYLYSCCQTVFESGADSVCPRNTSQTTHFLFLKLGFIYQTLQKFKKNTKAAGGDFLCWSAKFELGRFYRLQLYLDAFGGSRSKSINSNFSLRDFSM